MIVKDNKVISSIYNGDKAIEKIYKGTLVIFQSFIELVKNGVPPLNIYSSGANLINYKMYGNILQNGVPTPTAPIEIVSVGVPTKNLYNQNSTYLMNAGCLQGTSTYTFPGTSGGNRETYFFKCKPNTTYTFSCENVGDRLGIFGLNEEIIPSLDTSITFDNAFKGNTTSGIVNEYTWTTKENTKMCAIYWSVNKKPTKIMIEENDEVTEYELGGYKIPVKVSNDKEEVITNIYLSEPLRKIGEYADYIDFENKKVVRVIEKRSCGELEWYQHATYKYVYVVNSARFKSGINPISEVLNSTKYQPSESIRNMTTDFCIKIHATSQALYISDSVHTTEDEFMEFIKDKYIYYVLKTPEEETIELPSIAMVKGSVVLETDTRLQPSNLEIIYLGK